jgi:hypothetical protein
MSNTGPSAPRSPAVSGGGEAGLGPAIPDGGEGRA